ncbi:hypothetical protein J7E96_13040 [Streptomyces sp. ISL-96]|uniref:hypothetical protein n=1 Tax=Streptomyces sp. ISL-96 TaxID=2819191 RepID=UPI001BE7928A|nr:hypothetical protein [Streptomyces sp. ISL-96]MBT2489430.1 hypothetical protein [Streptomyces sp. ISL-96]
MSTVARDLPRIETLSQSQQRGVDCVFCGITLTPRTAVDLGPRRLRILGHVTHWYPRACGHHPVMAEYLALIVHTQDCPTCLDGCATGDRLRRADREARR